MALLLTPYLYGAGMRMLKGRVQCQGRGVADVVVTDGEHFAVTDAKGRYTLESDDDSRFVYITVPAGYMVETRNSVPQFWRCIEPGTTVFDFELQRKEQDDTRHGFIAIADPQIWAEKEFPLLEEAMRDIRTTVESYDIPFHGLCCGDVTSYDHGFYDRYNRTAALSGIPYFSAMGNHDMTLYGRTFETSWTKWEETFGPTYFSFDVGEAHYVILNDNFYIGRDYFYIGYIDERQMRWLERDLGYVPKEKLVIVCMHIPSTCEPSDRERFTYDNISLIATNASSLHRLLEPYNAHIISGHMHTAYNQIIGERLYEHVTPAISGAWWQGPLCTDGTPRGYEVYEVDGTDIRWYYKPTDHAADHQMVVYDGAEHPQFAGYVVANIWDSDTSWDVRIRFDDGTESRMERFKTYDPAAQKMYATTEGLDHEYVYPTPADHFYRAAVVPGAESASVTATDRFGRTYTRTITLKRTTE